jgi:putative ABC transport system permease protein
MGFVMRTAIDPGALAPAIAGRVQAVDSQQPVFNVKTLQQRLDDSVAQPRFRATLLTILAGIALVLASVGIYGVMAYYVTQRTHEIGVRMALGARRGDILKLVLRQGLTLVVIGIVVGLVAMLPLSRVISSLFFGISPTDVATFAGIPLLAIVVAATAIYIPARRAMDVDPIIALRYE